jgi:phenylpyruvate tautomerase PptA (4-oxalocrotonate tautomerase family)
MRIRFLTKHISLYKGELNNKKTAVAAGVAAAGAAVVGAAAATIVPVIQFLIFTY